MNIRNKLILFKNKTIKVEQLMNMAGYMEYEDFVKIVGKCVEDEILDPVKSSTYIDTSMFSFMEREGK